ncbi:cytidylyltransferase family protein [Rhodopila globiformis]|uniref:CDP-archaeol synthase n=1 Tax=Rhodopila globiformis TaxID=1071 RepID=A0A2S6N0A5_RHOGL|nr:CDP-archaeol synthase [Rhodopila globiformis]PPQ28051.1 hypothetical protein CCS01_25630 [Rhodopila globiformis]
MPDPVAVLCVLVLLGAANGSPILAKKLLRDRFAAPLDGGTILWDGRPLFGASKTIRGFLVSIVVTALVAVLLGYDWSLGALFGAASLAGDLLSSFLKRRLGLWLHDQASGLDQIPEALVPTLLLRNELGLSAGGIAVTVVAFVILALVLSRLLFALRIRDRPY